MSWNFNDSTPIYQQLIEQIKFKIISGVYTLGEKIPSVRDMASEASVNPNTMQKALSELEKTGLVYSQRTVGRFITEDKKMIKEMQSNLAKEEVEKFILNMKNIGFATEEIISMIKKVEKEMN